MIRNAICYLAEWKSCEHSNKTLVEYGLKREYFVKYDKVRSRCSQQMLQTLRRLTFPVPAHPSSNHRFSSITLLVVFGIERGVKSQYLANNAEIEDAVRN